MEENLALIRTIIGENSGAISTLTRLVEVPYRNSITPGAFEDRPDVGPLARADPAFRKLYEEKPQ